MVVDSRTAPAVGTVTADTPPSASPRSAVPAGTTSAPLAGRRARRAVRPKPSACRSSRLARAGARRQRARPRGRGLGRRTRRDAAAAASPSSTSRPTTASASSERSPATAGGTGTDVRGDRPGHSPRSPPSGTTPPRPAAVAAVPWQPHRPPPEPVTVVCVRLDAGGAVPGGSGPPAGGLRRPTASCSVSPRTAGWRGPQQDEIG